jgi:hypothetical protein
LAKGLIDGEASATKRLEIKGKSQAKKAYETFIIYHSAQIWFPPSPESTASAQFPNAT